MRVMYNIFLGSIALIAAMGVVDAKANSVFHSKTHNSNTWSTGTSTFQNMGLSSRGRGSVISGGGASNAFAVGGQVQLVPNQLSVGGSLSGSTSSSFLNASVHGNGAVRGFVSNGSAASVNNTVVNSVRTNSH